MAWVLGLAACAGAPPPAPATVVTIPTSVDECGLGAAKGLEPGVGKLADTSERCSQAPDHRSGHPGVGLPGRPPMQVHFYDAGQALAVLVTLPFSGGLRLTHPAARS